MSLLALQGLGLGLQVFGQIDDNKAAAEEARRSAAWLDQQAKYFREVTDRQKDIFNREARQFRSYQALATAGNGVSLEGSFLETEAQTEYLQQLEIEAIEAQGRMQIREAQLKASGLRHKADRLSSFEYNFMQAAGTVLSSNAFANIISKVGPKYSGTYTDTSGHQSFGDALVSPFKKTGAFFKKEYMKGVSRKNRADFTNSLLNNGGNF